MTNQLIVSKKTLSFIAWHDVTLVDYVADVKVEPDLLAAGKTHLILQRIELEPQLYSSGPEIIQ